MKLIVLIILLFSFSSIISYTSFTGVEGVMMYDNNGIPIQAHGGQIQK